MSCKDQRPAIRISSSRSSTRRSCCRRSAPPARRCRCARSSARSGLPKSMAFRLLYTLERCGMIEKVGENLYRSHVRPFKQRPYRLGYAAQGTDYQFSKEISTGLQRAAAAQGIELISRRQPLQPEDRAAQRRRPGAREGRPRHRVPDRRARRADRRGQVPRGEHPAHRDRSAASGRDLLRRQQLRGRPDRRTAPRPLGEAALARRGRRDRHASRSSAPAACRRCA